MTNLIQTLLGTWFVCSTTFPMWLKGDKTNPTFTYSIARHKGRMPVLLDQVRYVKNKRQKTLVGYDYQHVSDSSTFVWRGKGLLSWVRSTWKVVLEDPEGQWAVIWFSETLFTPEGIDVISRTSYLPAPLLTHIKSQIAATPLLAKHLITMRELPVRK